MKTQRIRILIADDHAIVRAGLASLLSSLEGLDVIAQARNGIEAMRLATLHNPDVIILDLAMPRKDGLTTSREMLIANPKARIIILTNFASSEDLFEAKNLGVSAIVFKSSSNDLLVRAIRKAAAGERFFDPLVVQQLKSDPPIKKLSPRQHDVLQSLSRGLTNKDIACLLGISEVRVEQLITSLLGKIYAANRTEAVAIALRKHLLKI